MVPPASMPGDASDAQRPHPLSDFLKEALSEPLRVKILYHAGKEHRALAQDLADDFAHLSARRPVCYLFDFDVLRSYLDLDSLTNGDQGYIDSLFLSPRTHFAIPAGAFLELFDWLSDQRTKASNFDTSIPQLGGRPGALRRLAELFGLKIDDESDDDQLVSEILSSVKRRTASLRRLYRLLQSRHFQGCVSDFDLEDQQHLQSILADIPRYSDVIRSHQSDRHVRKLRDERDAMNLAIALKSARTRQEDERDRKSPSRPYYLLVSQTSNVLYLPEKLLERRDSIRGDSEEYVRILRKVRGVEDRGDREWYPCLHPRRVVNVENAGVFQSRPSTRLEDIERLEQDMGYIARVLRRRAMVSLGQSLRPVSEEFPDAEWLSFVLTVERVAYRVQSDSVFVRNEMQRANAAQIAVAKIEQLRSDLPQPLSEADVIQQSSADLLGWFSGVYSALGDSKGVGYFPEIGALNSTGEQTFQIVQKPSPYGTTPAITGHVVRTSDSRQAPIHQCQVKWRVYCDLAEFLRSLKNLIQSSGNYTYEYFSTTPAIRLDPVPEDSLSRKNWVVIGTTCGYFGGAVGPFLPRGDSQVPSVGMIHQAVKDALTARDLGPLDRELDACEVRDITINTEQFTVSFDIVNSDDSPWRFLVFASQANLSDGLAEVYQATTLQIHLPGSPLAALKRVLRDVGT